MAITSFSHLVRPILIVDDDPISLRLTHTVLRRMGFDNTLTCQDSRQVVGLLTEQPISIVLLDLMMPHIGGEELLDFLTGEYPEILVIMNTATEDIDTAVRCIKKGAFDYMTKPIDFSRLSVVIKNALAFQELQQENLALKNHILTPGLKRRDVFDGIVTRNSQMLALFQYAEAIAQTSEPVLITGETGVGKDLIARAIHTLSNCRGSLVAVNVAGLDDNVFSDTLFGHAKGAFTGAEKPRSGLIEQATGGDIVSRRDWRFDQCFPGQIASSASGRRLFPFGPGCTQAKHGSDYFRHQPGPVAMGGTGRIPQGPQLPAAHPSYSPVTIAGTSG
jgi:DNA-binding NtrC family response regulator